jgi:hypothetical protein
MLALHSGNHGTLRVRKGARVYQEIVQRLLDQRVFVITGGDASLPIGSLAQATYTREYMERVLQDPKAPLSQPTVYTHYRDVYWSYRGLTHEIEQYLHDEVGEIPRLLKVEDALVRLNARLAWLRQDNFDDLLEEIEGLVDQALHILSPAVVVPEKVSARDQLVHIRTGRDKLYRVNPSALLARLVAARLRVGYREEGVANILDVLSARRQAVRLAIAVCETQVRIAANFLENVFKNWEPIIAGHRVFLADQLVASAKELRQIILLPFGQTFVYVSDEFQQANLALRRAEPEVARQLLQTAHASLQLRALRSNLEQTVFAVSRSLHCKEPLDHSRVLGEITQAATQLEHIDCSHMRAFSPKTVHDGLSIAGMFLGQTVDPLGALKQGHKKLREVVATI